MVGQPLRLPSFDPASDALALQIFNRLTNILKRYVGCEMRSADPRRHNESDFSTFEFFIELQCVDDLFSREVFRQTRGQFESREKIADGVALIRRESSSSDGDGARSDNSKAQRFSVKKFPVIARALDRVANCVPEIKKGALASLVALVFRYDPRFDLDVALNEPL